MCTAKSTNCIQILQLISETLYWTYIGDLLIHKAYANLCMHSFCAMQSLLSLVISNLNAFFYMHNTYLYTRHIYYSKNVSCINVTHKSVVTFDPQCIPTCVGVVPPGDLI